MSDEPEIAQVSKVWLLGVARNQTRLSGSSWNFETAIL
jgi:hypothetical protein